VQPAGVRRTVAVIGGGPGGMEAARVAALRGHRVTLFEKGAELGGTARFSSLTTPMNAELVRYLSTSLKDLDVHVVTGTEATPEAVRGVGAEVVVVATGARRERPDVPGAELPHVLSGDDLRAMLTGDDPSALQRLPLRHRLVVKVGRRAGMMASMERVRGLSKRWMPIGKDVVVVGGGLVGVELAEFLAERGRSVTVLESGDKLGVEMAHPRRARALFEARAHSVVLVTGAEVTEIHPDRVEYRVGERALVVHADHVVVASGVHADRGVAERMEAAGLEVHVVGDAAEVGYIQGAVRSGNLVGRAL
jgi:NADPH-dependent 2,4-dienoyl-CoA reductase/sulfur reductase-like enzyme